MVPEDSVSAGFSSIRSFTLISFSVKPAASGLNNRAILSRAASRLLYFPPSIKQACHSLSLIPAVSMQEVVSA